MPGLDLPTVVGVYISLEVTVYILYSSVPLIHAKR